MSKKIDYWKECVATAADECGVSLSAEQLQYIAESVEGCHDNYGLAFYEPPASDMLSEVERKWEQKYKALRAEFDAYENNAEKALKRALRMPGDSLVGIDSRGDVYRYDGRTERIL
jgi:translation elongation factor EF-Tu-like GTPase